VRTTEVAVGIPHRQTVVVVPEVADELSIGLPEDPVVVVAAARAVGREQVVHHRDVLERHRVVPALPGQLIAVAVLDARVGVHVHAEPGGPRLLHVAAAGAVGAFAVARVLVDDLGRGVLHERSIAQEIGLDQKQIALFRVQRIPRIHAIAEPFVIRVRVEQPIAVIVDVRVAVGAIERGSGLADDLGARLRRRRDLATRCQQYTQRYL
jgi:hypothetical protein